MAWVYAYYVLDVGQGTGTVVQVCDGNLEKPVWSAIIDLGSEGWPEDVKAPLASAKFAAKKLKKGRVGQDVTLDAVILSHSDSDHINLIPDLLKEFSNPRAPTRGKPTLWVKEVWYGGNRSKYAKGQGKNVLDELNEYRPLDKKPSILKSPKNDASSLDKTPPKPLVDSGMEASIWLLIGNTISENVSYESNSPTKSAKGPYETNTKSLVVAVTFGEGRNRKRIIATGDATGLTIFKCREKIAKWREKTEEKLAPSLSVTLPHHGSSSTTYDIRGLKGGETSTKTLAQKNIDGFAKDLEPVTISASAGERSTYRHPAIAVVKDFGAYVGEKNYTDPAFDKKAPGEHFYTAHMQGSYFEWSDAGKPPPPAPSPDWPSKAGWYSARTVKNVFTTDYFIDRNEPVPIAWPQVATYKAEQAFSPPPLRTISWLFIVLAGGEEWEVERAVDTLGMSEDQARHLEAAIGGPLPEERFVHIPSADARDRRR